MSKQLHPLAFSILLATFSSTSLASGFVINEQSASGVGTAYAGRAAVVEDASVVFYNPAGMSKLNRAELSLGATYIDIEGKFSNGARTNPAGIPSAAEPGAYDNGGNFIPNATIPFVYYAKPIDEKFAVGFGLFVPYGTGSDYSKNALVGGFAGETSLQVINFQPTLSYKILDNLAIGGGIDIAYAKGKLTKQLDLVPFIPPAAMGGIDVGTNMIVGEPSNNPDAMGYEGTFEVEGDSVTYGFNLGLMWDISDATTLGLTYRSKMKLDLKGDADIYLGDGLSMLVPGLGVVPISEVPTQKAKVPLDGPQTATLSLAHRLTDDFQLQGGVTWTDWSSFQYFDVIGREPGMISQLSGLNVGDHAGKNYIGHIVEKWKDTYAFAIGGTYTLNDQWLLRGGFAYDMSPVKDEHRTARVPDNDRKWLTAGARYNVNQDLSFDLGLAYLFMNDTSINEVGHDLNDEVVVKPGAMGPEGVTGDYKMDAFGVSLQMNYRM